MRRVILALIILSVGLTGIAMASGNASKSNGSNDIGFPGREEFPKIPIIEISELNRIFSEVVIVDTRSHYEYDTLRVKGSINIPVAEDTFEQNMMELRAKTSKPIVFYCNGRTCYKSYIAVKKSEAAGVTDTHAFDAGIFEWVNKYPSRGELLGKSPVDLKNLIATNKFKARLLDPDTFSEKAADLGPNSIVLDVRDKFQRAGVGFFPGKERWVSLDDKEKLAKYLKKAKLSNKTLFIYDEVGKQVRWLQYALEEAGIRDYYFMHDGAKAYYSQLSTWK
ncbi:MAG: rhodanese-like domain-containing protein [Gammaproteobacteria bacterium]|jgi:rhodanese-related sulfurtransferase|nr:rhodanese-like domain-containing protein [Gammaproteobacteria bacterium]